MEHFQYTRARTISEAIGIGAQSTTAQQGAPVRFLAGGTTLVDLMKLNVEHPTRLVDINHLGLNSIERTADGGRRIGAMVRNATLAHDPSIVSDYRVLSEALLSGASAQLRNVATTGGNLLQRTRCMYFRNTAMACNKRDPGSGCSAIAGDNRSLAILGTSPQCIATNPSDMNVALAALEATVHIQGSKGERTIPFQDFHLVPGDTPQRETVLEPGDLVTHVTLPPPRAGVQSRYLKLRDRASYEFALASTAVVTEVAAGRFRYVRIAMGGVGTKPWRMLSAEQALTGASVDEGTIVQAARLALADARPQSENGFKVELAQRCLAHALRLSTGMVSA